MQAFAEYMGRIVSTQTLSMTRTSLDLYQPDFYSLPTVYVLEERQIGQRTYPTRYVVTYQDQALAAGISTCVDDSAGRRDQVGPSRVIERRATRSWSQKEEEAVHKRQEALDDLIKKKDDADKKKFKKGQADLGKELGF